MACEWLEFLWNGLRIIAPEWKTHSRANNKPSNIAFNWSAYEKGKETLEPQRTLEPRNDRENDSRKCGTTIRTRGPFHRRFSRFHVRLRFARAACQQSSFLPLAICARCVVQRRKLPAFLTPAPCETRDSVGPIIRNDRIRNKGTGRQPSHARRAPCRSAQRDSANAKFWQLHKNINIHHPLMNDNIECVYLLLTF